MSSLYGPIRYSEEELRKNTEFMDSRDYHQQHIHHYNSGLVRIRSDEQAIRSEDDHPYSQTLSSETETLLAKFMSSSNGWSHSDSFIGDNSVKQEAMESAPQGVQNGYAYEPHMSYQPQASGYPNLNFNARNHFDGSFSMQNSLDVPEYALQPEMDSRNSSSLIRQNSSPPGFFSKSIVENGFAGLTQMGGSRASDIGNGVAKASAINDCKSRYLSRENIDAAVHESGILEICDGNRKAKSTGFVNDSWDSGAFSGLKPARDNDGNMFYISNSKEIQAAEVKQHNHGLCKQLSWPSSSTKMVSAEKLFQLQGSVQFKIRAKRGFATHPRSIAERIRRTRISEKIKTLEGLFPEMDKQAKTADKLELAVWYIKDLQKQIKMLTSARVKCTCLSEPEQD